MKCKKASVTRAAVCCGLFFFFLSVNMETALGQEGKQWISYEPGTGPGNGKHIVLVSGDEEYRSEEALPLLASILAEKHGFKTTVLFAINPETGNVDPEYQTNIPGLAQLRSADLMVLFTRFRELPDEQMKYIHEYIAAGKPVVGLRTATHAFNYKRNTDSPYAKYDFRSEKEGWEGGFGRQILGETWIDHHGVHGEEGTRGLIDGIEERKEHPILQGVHDIWGPTDVYGVTELDGDPEVLVWGQSTAGLRPEAPLNWEKSIMPVAWTREYSSASGKSGRVFATTMGAAVDLKSEGLRRLLVNACYWAAGMEDEIPDQSDVSINGEYNPTMFGFGDHRKGLAPSDFK
ncbi:ThuA domain-containing protein [Fodinibius sediminis]|uniref:Type 1 glutamine amidotransferase (GATase1) n=1 Tax=Fodinibius sediminis TaxID=1214077 RepID=A0A521BNS9_9BACT|nr:ThuA domain-containing protein [Fodinibius sediminis]SMO48766.1 Type 1 glutamine amidotransferase (GATase1) [Fodinibius sediminis]